MSTQKERDAAKRALRTHEDWLKHPNTITAYDLRRVSKKLIEIVLAGSTKPFDEPTVLGGSPGVKPGKGGCTWSILKPLIYPYSITKEY